MLKIAALITFLVAWGVVSIVVQRRLRRSVKAVADGLRTMRRLQTQVVSYVPRRPDHTVNPVVDAMYSALISQTSALPLTTFGDFMETRVGGAARGPVRWFTDEAQTTCGWFAVLDVKKGPLPVMSLFSESAGGAFIYTVLGAANPALAHPPTLTRTRMPWTDGIAAAFERHRAEQRRVATDAGSWRKVANMDEAAAMLERLRLNNRTWRSAQNKQELLEADARGILGKHFAQMGAAVMQQVAEEPDMTA